MTPGQFSAFAGLGAAACLILFAIFVLLCIHVQRHWSDHA